MSALRALGLAIVVGLLLVGCGKHYWNKPAGTANDFARDSGECARENALYMSANKDYGIVRTDLYKACLKGRGWERAQSPEPPANWFRGIESDEPVRLDQTPPQPPSPPRSGLPSTPSGVAAELVGPWEGQLTRPSITGRRLYPARLRMTEDDNRLRGSLEVSGMDLRGSGDVVKSGTEISLSGQFGQRALRISFTLAVNGSALDANGLGADGSVIGRVHRSPMVQLETVVELHTFSITARDRETGAFGVAVATARPSVGSLVPWVSPRGAIATQARVNTELGRQGLALLAQGVPVDVALSALLRKDGDREIRQVHGLDAERAFCHTGTGCVPWCGHEQDDGFTVAGNMLVGPDVIGVMARTFRANDSERRDLSERLLLALEAGQAAGGDKRGKQSAALLVAAAREPRMYHNLRVDDHADPVAELRRIWEVVVAHTKQIEAEYGSAAVRLFGRVKS